MTPPKVRVHEISKVLGNSNAEVIDALEKELGIKVKSHSSTVDKSVADKIIRFFKNGKTEEPAAPKEEDTIIGGINLSRVVLRKAAPKPAPEPVEEPKVEAKPETPAAKSTDTVVNKPAAPSTDEPPKTEAPATSKPVGSAPAAPVESSAKPATPSVTPRPIGTSASWPSPQAPVRKPAPPQPSATPNYPSRTPEGPSSGATPSSSPNPRSGATRRQQQHRPGQALEQNQNRFGGGRPSGGGGGSRGRSRAAARSRREDEPVVEAPTTVQIDDAIVVRDLAAKLHMRDTEVIKHLFMKGMMVTVNQTLDVDFARNLAAELGFEVLETKTDAHEGEYVHLGGDDKKLDEKKFQNLQGRPPVISIMGHVDHGKTTLLDSIRESRHKVVESEAGGITQSIGAYTVEKNDRRIVFLDTPGHEAFTSMRMRGAQATDIAILVVAADDGVMPQTIEAINHAKVAKIPIIIAVNKIDKPDADPDKVLVQLSEYGLNAEKWGGDTLTVEVSALQKLGLDDLLDNILLVSELLDLQADPTVPATGVIVEAQLDKRMGPVATALVQNGTLRVGEHILVGSVGGRVRALISDSGERVQEAGPSTPVEILGLDGVPNAGESFKVILNDKAFKQELQASRQRERDQRMGVSRTIAAGFSGHSEDEESPKEKQFNLVVKADTQGSLEALVDVLQRLTNDEVKINIVHSGTGDLSEADIMLAATAQALVIGFNSKADNNAQRLAEAQEVNIKFYDVIYHIMEDLEKWVLGQLDPETEEVLVGSAEVRQIFKVGKTGIIAGCMVTSGKIIRNAKAVVTRNGKEVFSGPLNNLKRFKDDVKEVASGYECGISFERYNDLQEGDVIDVFTVKSLERTSL